MYSKIKGFFCMVLSGAMLMMCVPTVAAVESEAPSVRDYGVMAAEAVKSNSLTFEVTKSDKGGQSGTLYCCPPTVVVKSSAGLASYHIHTQEYDAKDKAYKDKNFTDPDGNEITEQNVENSPTEYTISFPQIKTSYLGKEMTSDVKGNVIIDVKDVNGETANLKIYVDHTPKYRENRTVPATCTEDGYDEDWWVCRICGEEYGHYTTNIKPATGHDIEGVSPTSVSTPCKLDGKTLDQYVCNKCGLIVTTVVDGKDEEYKESDHQWVKDNTYEPVEASCEVYGYHFEKCENCGAIKTIIDAQPLGHLPDGIANQTVGKQPTCTEEGEKYVACERCRKQLGDVQYIPALGHDWVPDNAEAANADCTQSYTGFAVCSRCGEKEDNHTFPATEHQYHRETVKEPTCTQDGYTAEVCKVCGKEKENSHITLNALGHVSEVDDYDCSTPITCTVCNSVLTEAMEHNLGSWYSAGSYHARKCQNSGCKHIEVGGEHISNDPEKSCLYSTKCSVCGAIISPRDHTPTETAVPVADTNILKATPMENGPYHAVICTVCHRVLDRVSGHIMAFLADDGNCETPVVCFCGVVVREGKTHKFTKYIDDGDQHIKDCTNAQCDVRISEVHDYNYKSEQLEFVDATCTAEGSYILEKECICGAKIAENVTIPVKGHSFGELIVEEPHGCVTEGASYRECTVCKYREYETAPSSGHTMPAPENYTIDKEPTCTSDGSKSYHCTVCGEIIPGTDVVIPHIPHTFEPDPDDGSPATCTDSGFTVSKCSVCGALGDTIEIPALGHDHSDSNWVCVRSNTCTEDCVQSNACTRCGYLIERPCPEHKALGHDWSEYIHNNDAGYDKNATETRICERCGEQETREIEGTALHDHVWVNYVYNNDATCESDGTETAVCERGCGTLDTRTVEGTKLEHLFVNYIADNNATCTEDGTKTAVCEYCKKAADTIPDEGSALGHLFIHYQPMGDATCMEDGHEAAECENGCGYKDVREIPGSKIPHDFLTYVSDGDETCTEDGHETSECELGCGTEDRRTIEGSAHHIWVNPVFEWSEDNTTAVLNLSCERSCGKDLRVDAEVKITEKQPTCEEPGSYTREASATAEGITYVDAVVTKVIDPLGHSWGEPVFTWNGAEVTAEAVCKNDSGHILNCDITVTSEIKTPALCESKGTTLYTASTEVDGKTYTSTHEEENLVPLGHLYETSASWSDDNSKAEITITCSRDNTHTHRASATVKSAVKTQQSCVNPGVTVYTAEAVIDGKTYTVSKEETVPATGHNYQNGSCVNCGASLVHSHYGSGEYYSDITGHWQNCGVCGAKMPSSAHVFENGVCTVCKASDPSYKANTNITVNTLSQEVEKEYFDEVNNVSGEVYGVYYISAKDMDYNANDIITVRVYAPGASASSVVIIRDEWEILNDSNMKIDGDYVEFTVKFSMIEQWHYFAVVSGFAETESVRLPAESAVNREILQAIL